MRVLDLFSGIGGFSLGLESSGYKIIAHSEIDSYACKVYHKHFPNSKCLGDIKSIDWSNYVGAIDLICGGFPCQPFSLAGNRRGKDDNRHLWPEYLRAVKTIKPSWVIGENVPGIINMELDKVLFDLENEGYSTRTFVIPAVSVNARHRRDRVWIIANNNDSRDRTSESIIEQERTQNVLLGYIDPQFKSCGHCKTISYADSDMLQRVGCKRSNVGSLGLCCGAGGGMFPTPMSSDCQGGKNVLVPGTNQRISKSRIKHGAKLANIYGSGRLNPDWVEWLMGYPIGWTDLNA